jgi:nucleoside-diphosphate-sugar epimerase
MRLLSKKKILITGTSGYLGNFLLKKLSILFDVSSLNRNQKVFNNKVKVLDNRISNKITGIKFDTLIHCAGISDINKSFEYKDYIDSNVNLTKKMIIFCFKNKIKNFIFLSSIRAEDHFKFNDYKTYYGHSKLMAEQAIIKFCRKYKINYLIIRLPRCYGVNFRGNLFLLIRFIKKLKVINIKNNKNFILLNINNLSDFISQVIEKNLFRKNLKLTLSDNLYYSLNKIYKSIKYRKNKKTFNIKILDKAINIFIPENKYKIETNKLKILFKWKPKHNLMSIVDEI